MQMTTYDQAEMITNQFGYTLMEDDALEPGTILIIATTGEVCIHPSESSEPCQPSE